MRKKTCGETVSPLGIIKKSINLIVAPASDKNETGRNLERRMASVTSKDFKEVKTDRQIRMPNEIDKQIMKIKFLGTGAAEGIPSTFRNCKI